MKNFSFTKSAVVLMICFFIVPKEHHEDFLIYYGQPLATMSYIAIILSAVFVAIQALLFRVDYQSRIEHSEFEKSYELSGYYSKTILPKTPFASEFLNRINCGIDPNYYSKTLQFKDFTADEAKKFSATMYLINLRKNGTKIFPLLLIFV